MSIAIVDTNGCIARTNGVEHSLHAKRGAGDYEAKDTPDVVRELRAKLEDYSRRRARRAGWTRRFIPTRLTPLDTVLPNGGLPCGCVTEILSNGPGVGAMSLTMRVARRCAANQGKTEKEHRSIVLVDMFGDFYPPAVCQYGIELERLIVIRAGSEGDAFWAVEQSLRCSAVAAVVAPLRHFDERLSRRLQLAAESSGCLGLILRSADRHVKSFAAVQMLVESVGDEGLAEPTFTGRPCTGRHVHAYDSYLCRITLLKVREGMPTKPLLVDLDHETGDVPLHAVPVDRPAAKRA